MNHGGTEDHRAALLNRAQAGVREFFSVALCDSVVYLFAPRAGSHAAPCPLFAKPIACLFRRMESSTIVPNLDCNGVAEKRMTHDRVQNGNFAEKLRL